MLKPIIANTIFEADSVYQVKECPDHGDFKILIEKDLSYYLKKDRFDKPGTITPSNIITEKGCPFDCGLCPEHGQHSCIGLIEITTACDQRCPVCYAKGLSSNTFLSIDQIDEMLDFFVKSEGGRAEILQISGGEPTLHNDLLQIIDLAMSKNINHIMLIQMVTDLPLSKTLQRNLRNTKTVLKCVLNLTALPKKQMNILKTSLGIAQNLRQ